MAKGSSLSRKEPTKEGALEHQEGRKNSLSKNMGTYNRLSFSSWVFKIMFDGWNKDHANFSYCKYLRQIYYKLGRVRGCENR